VALKLRKLHVRATATAVRTYAIAGTQYYVTSESGGRGWSLWAAHPSNGDQRHHFPAWKRWLADNQLADVIFPTRTELLRAFEAARAIRPLPHIGLTNPPVKLTRHADGTYTHTTPGGRVFRVRRIDTQARRWEITTGNTYARANTLHEVAATIAEATAKLHRGLTPAWNAR